MYPANPEALASGFALFGACMKRLILLIDGGFLRVAARKAGHDYTPDFIAEFAHQSFTPEEELWRILYYDCAPYHGEQKLPISGQAQRFDSSDGWLKELARKDLFAIRLGVLKFRGYKLKKRPKGSIENLCDDDFRPDFEQKGVDMRIGLDIASYAGQKAIDRIALVTADTDCVPAMKYARKSGAQVVLITLPGSIVPEELTAHADMVRRLAWPDSST